MEAEVGHELDKRDTTKRRIEYSTIFKRPEINYKMPIRVRNADVID